MRPLIFLALLLLPLLAFPARSDAEEYVLCLQRQLNALGYDAGPEDGLWGKRTRAAALALRAENPKLTENPYLANASRASAIAWCREVGSKNFRTRRYRPSIKEPDFYFGPEYSPIQKNMVRRSAADAWAFLKSNLNFDMASRIDVVAGRDPRKIAGDIKKLNRNRGYQAFPDQYERIRKKCTDSRHWTAYAYFDFVMVCSDKEMSDDTVWTDDHPWLTRVFVHEFIHSFQSEYSLAKTLAASGKSRLETMGPGWMIEGAAMMAELEFLDHGKLSLHSTPFTKFLQAPAKESKLRLSKMGRVRKAEEYEVARFAAYLLAKRVSVSRMMDYWRLLGHGKSQNQAFTEIFGMGLKEFEEHFQKARVDLLYALKFARGKI